jgi:hypothetical protein
VTITIYTGCRIGYDIISDYWYIIVPASRIFSRYELPSNKIKDKSRSEEIVRIDENRLLESYQDLQEVKNPETTDIAIIIITKYSIWIREFLESKGFLENCRLVVIFK